MIGTVSLFSIEQKHGHHPGGLPKVTKIGMPACHTQTRALAEKLKANDSSRAALQSCSAVIVLGDSRDPSRGPNHLLLTTSRLPIGSSKRSHWRMIGPPPTIRCARADARPVEMSLVRVTPSSDEGNGLGVDHFHCRLEVTRAPVPVKLRALREP
jgi:hypothetical protein